MTRPKIGRPVTLSHQFAVEVDPKLFGDLLVYEIHLHRQPGPHLLGGLYDDLQELDGVTNVDYDGHFGAYVIYSLDFDTTEEYERRDEAHAQVKAVIALHLQRAANWRRRNAFAIRRKDTT